MGVLGGLMVFWLGIRHGRREEQEKQERELMTTLKLLFEEIGHHRPALRVYAEKHDLALVQPPPLDATIWDETRSTIAQSHYVDLWADLLIYFSLLKRIMRMKDLPIPKPLENPVLVKRLAEARKLNEDLREQIEKIVMTDAENRDRRALRKRFWKRSKKEENLPLPSDSSEN